MDLSQAIALHEVGALKGSRVIEHPSKSKSAWVIEFDFVNKPPSQMSARLENAKGVVKVFRTAEAAFTDLKTIGFQSALVDLKSIESFRHNRFAYLYEWIRSLHQAGYDEDKIIETFATYEGIRLDRSNPNAVRQARIIIRHALGLVSGKKLDEFNPPVDVIDIKRLKDVPEGYLFQAICSNADESFQFLIDNTLPEKDLLTIVAGFKQKICKLVLVAAHTRHPYQITDENAVVQDGVITAQAAKCKLTREDMLAISS